MTKRLGFFTRLLPAAPDFDRDAGVVYRTALEQFAAAERLGYDVGWVAQHHFDPDEGGLPSPFVFLAAVAAGTRRIRLGTGIITLPLEDPVRVAEDAVVADLLSGGRIELGLGSGGSPSSFTAFGKDSAARSSLYATGLQELLDVLAGRPIRGTGAVLHPTGSAVRQHIWQATFSASGGTRAGVFGSGLLLSRTQPRTEDAPHATLTQLQQPIVDAYLAALPAGAEPRIGASRSVLVGRNAERVLELARVGVRRHASYLAAKGQSIPVPDNGSVEDADALLAANDLIVGTPEQVIEALSADPVVTGASDLMFQVHPADPDPDTVLESLELLATEVAPALGWRPGGAGDAAGEAAAGEAAAAAAVRAASGASSR
ncbi:putative FMN-dependent luciferase-like monooxygenase [Nakamurella lactea]|uniref:putative FMN-dependent luciferase-like monooxygenase n=1 Tax=Nakamurella lactea TaxID=459515 RepID=UPI0003FCFF24|nr:putative FMN-dependent luciferase-like monooxygenase [Nakamurella lactea]